jgi:Telomeric single stranded DNA binding POT1/CDC13
VNTIDIDHPTPEPEVAAPARIPTPEPERSPSVISTQTPSALPDHTAKIDDEWSSPAFLKRGRTSYGSLFESDPWAEEDGTMPGKGRKRTKLSSIWRYTSRSPTPEVEERAVEPVPTPPEAPPKPTPIMTDEACQTIGLEIGNAAEALADFARQATNVGSNSYSKVNRTFSSGPATVQEEASATTHETTAPPLDAQSQRSEENVAQEDGRPQQLPISPRLDPISSDSLPLVSPLASRKYGVFTEPLERTEEQVQNFHDPSVPMSNGFRQDDEIEEDIYEASPPHHRDEPPVTGFQEFMAGQGGVEIPSFEDQYLPEDQYGRWQGIAHLSNTASPFRGAEPFGADAHQVQFYPEENQEQNHLARGLSPPQDVVMEPQQYPELDEESSHVASTWGSGRVVYPDLPDLPEPSEMPTHGPTAPPAPPRSTEMSRSQSVQSQVVDLTESSDEEESDRPVEGSVEEEYEEDEEEADRPLNSHHGRYAPQNLDVEAEEELEGPDDGEEAEYDDEITGNDTRYSGPNHHLEEEEEEEEFGDEEEEGSYDDEDEEMEDYESPARPPVQQNPVFIDLLSSDDEENEEAEPKATNSAPQNPKATSQAAQSSRNASLGSEESESEEDPDDEDPVPYAERAELKTIPSRIEASLSVEEEDEFSEEDQESGDASENEDGSESGMEDSQPQNGETGKQRSISVGHESADKDVGSENLDTEPSVVVRDEDGDSEDAENEDEEATPMQADSPAKMSKALATETQNPPPERPSLFDPVFNLDGANDERLPEVSYPTLSEDEPSPPATIPEEHAASQNSDTQLQRGGNTQLPTPADTQLSEKVLSPEASFSSAVEVPHLAEEQQPAPHEFIDAAESVTKVDTESNDGQPDTQDPAVNSVEADGAETIVITETTAEITIEEETSREIQTDEMEIIVTGTALTDSQDPEQMTIDEPAPVTMNEDIEISVSKEAPDITAPEKEDETIQRDHSETATADEAATEEVAPDSVQKKNGHIETVREEPEFTVDAPRRSHRRVKSTLKSITNSEEKTISSAANAKEKPAISGANTKENERPRTPVKTRGARRDSILDDQLSPMVVLDARVTPKGHDASAELALQALDSPSKPLHDLRKHPVADLKLRLSRSLRTELSEFTALKVLRYHIKQKLDVLAVATTTPPQPQRAKGGPRHYSVTFNITDPTIAPSGVTEVQVFRPYKEALPHVEAGDGILLRNFQVASVKRGFALQSLPDEGSSWVVFKESEDPEIRGPPVEFGVLEKNHIVQLKDWYQGLDSLSVQKINRANADKAKA